MARYFEDILDYDKGTPEELFNLYLSEEKHRSVFDKKDIRIGKNKGDRIRIYNRTSYNNYISGRNLLVIPNTMIIQALRSESWDKKEKDAIVILRFSKYKGSARVQLVNANLPENEQQVVDRGMFFELWRIFIRGDKDMANTVLNTTEKVKVLRLFLAKGENFTATDKKAAEIIDVPLHLVTNAMKELQKQKVLKRYIIKKGRPYKLNESSLTVQNLIKPAFEKEIAQRKQVINFLNEKIKAGNLSDKINSLLIYGKFQAGNIDETNDVNVAIISKNNEDRETIKKKYNGSVQEEFSRNFGVKLDTYVESEDTFKKIIKKEDEMKFKPYEVVYGKDVLS